MTLTEELRQSRLRWHALSLYEKFEQLVIFVLTVLVGIVVAVATWQLVLHTGVLIRSHLFDPANFDIFQSVFGMIFTVLIALEFRHAVLVVTPGGREIVQAKSVVLIALLALARKFIILDIRTTTPALVAALSAATLALGLVYWLIREPVVEEEVSDGR